jgi:SAM-dependent methyltransferase
MSRKSELDLIADRYHRRKLIGLDNRYFFTNPAVWQGVQEKQRALIDLISSHGYLEIGCGNGSNLLELVRLGFSAKNLIANELLPDRVKLAKENLPSLVKVLEGDALSLDIEDESLDIVYQSTVFSSILDEKFQSKLAEKMWAWVKPGGGILWYDFTHNNPSNPDVKGITLKRIRDLFPEGKIDLRRVTLAPPISRRVCKLHPNLYHVFNVFPFLRTHVLCWIGKV